MRNRNYQYFITLCILLGTVLLFPTAGCTDDPEHAHAKQIRQEMSEILGTVSSKTDTESFQTAENQMRASITQNPQAGQVTADSARLASGSLALARGRRMQIDLDLKILPLREAIQDFERTLRSAEDLVLEKARIEDVLEQDRREITELQQVLSGAAQEPGLIQQLETAQTRLDELQQQKQQAQAKRDEIQAVLDDYQKQADDLLRQAELQSGDQRLQLEKQAYALLRDRKQHYIDVQAAEDRIAILDDRIELAQSKVDNLRQSISETRQRVQSIESSETRNALQQQLRDVEQTLAVRQQQLVSAADAVTAHLQTYREAAEAVCDIFKEAAEEFQRVRSRDAAFMANLQLAESYHYAAQACAAVMRARNDTTYRMEDLVSVADAAFQDMLQDKLPVAQVEPDRADEVLSLYDQAIEAYQKAFDAAGGMDQQVRVNVLKSQLLTADSKMRLADALSLPNVAEMAATQRAELIERGQAFGVPFTQSEALKLVQEGIAYTPTLPVNLDVLASQLESRFTAWKRLPVAEQAAAVEQNLAEMQELFDRYGQSLADKLEPIRQEMQVAQQQGFEETAAGAGTDFGDPNSF